GPPPSSATPVALRRPVRSQHPSRSPRLGRGRLQGFLHKAVEVHAVDERRLAALRIRTRGELEQPVQQAGLLEARERYRGDRPADLRLARILAGRTLYLRQYDLRDRSRGRVVEDERGGETQAARLAEP